MEQDKRTQLYGQRVWSIVTLFYQSLIEFDRQYADYEDKVLTLARETGIEREVLRLRAAELAGLLDFKSLEALRDDVIHELKDLCHVVFRTPESTDPLDRYVSDIFHEISILKEEHYTLKTYAPLYEEQSENVELDYILDEAHTLFPRKLRQVLFLFSRAQEVMERHLANYGEIPIFIRSLYLQQDDFVKKAYPRGLEEFYGFMYACGPQEGFYEVGMSFYHSGFYPEALIAFRKAEEHYDDALALAHRSETLDAAAGSNGPGRATLARVRELRSSCRAKLERLESIDIVAGKLPSDLLAEGLEAS